MTPLMEALKSAQFLMDAKGERIAVQLSMPAWEALLQWIEDQEDKAILKAALPELQRLQAQSDTPEWLDWSEVRDSWECEASAL